MKEKNNWEKGVDLIVDSLGYAVVRFAPVIAPIPSIAVILEVSNYSAFAWFTVTTIEAVGYAIGDKMVESVRRKVLPMRQAIIPLIVYALVIEGLMLGYKVIPAWTGDFVWAEAIRSSVSVLYPFFTLAGAGLYALHEYLKEVQSDTQYEKATARSDKESDAQAERELKRQRQQAELEAYKAKLAQDAELERERVLAELRIKEQKAAVKAAMPSATESATSQKVKPASQSTGYDDQMAMLTIYQSEPALSDEKMAARIGKSKKTVQDLLADLVAKEVVHIEKLGRGKSVTVNGKFPAFKAGEMNG